jgi:hypothetical protein
MGAVQLGGVLCACMQDTIVVRMSKRNGMLPGAFETAASYCSVKAFNPVAACVCVSYCR